MSNDDNPSLDEVPEGDGRGRYFNADGVPISILAWARLTQDESYKVMARELVGDFEVITAGWDATRETGMGCLSSSAR